MNFRLLFSFVLLQSAHHNSGKYSVEAIVMYNSTPENRRKSIAVIKKNTIDITVGNCSENEECF